ncbi:MAG TPA: helix-turn-helix domain-containing protein [Methanotrichaceae archaeon]|nr:helix-turn-helix domain-containing protein [Methanotrichaceae archaeon]HQF16530.1 helix-turn-helix domain-containing protein [Methanotrichaceae archaeon]HQI91099.1 helix-turn-helix domain-containing protein [Methanotrichaceae archaeon]HQJ28510.1 helix-turn-helix domain-containing protein [Methanotrichaceae archaeon]
MDPIQLLDILGNENRRRILQLLSFRPFYFNEIAKRLDVGPKAVIDHLEMLEEAGIVECYTDERRRKYFRIASNMVLEVALSPYSYGVRAYGGPPVMTSSQLLECPDLQFLNQELGNLESRRIELRQLMAELDSKEIEIKKIAAEAIRTCAQDVGEMEILRALLSGVSDLPTLARRLEMPEGVVKEILARLEARGAIRGGPGGWRI